MSTTDLAPDPTTTDTSEPEVAHIAPAADVSRAYVTGEAITALCGVVFVPTRDPNRYPVCEPCKAVLDQIKAGRGGANSPQPAHRNRGDHGGGGSGSRS